jgi:hypothetical protein
MYRSSAQLIGNSVCRCGFLRNQSRASLLGRQRQAARRLSSLPAVVKRHPTAFVVRAIDLLSTMGSDAEVPIPRGWNVGDEDDDGG